MILISKIVQIYSRNQIKR